MPEATSCPASAASVAGSAAADDRPVVLVPACQRQLGEHPFHIVGRKYVDAVRLAGCIPLVVPVADEGAIGPLLDLADGVLLTGSPSNVHPRHFGEPVQDPSLPLDEDRDGWTLPLIRAAHARGQPLFAICRGLQECNVALGGDLHQAVQSSCNADGEPHADHRSNPADPAEAQYGPAHPGHLVPGGQLAGWLGAGPIVVNSLHGQGVRRLAPGLEVEARAPDGVVEALASADRTRFFVAVQWHPEWRAAENPVSLALLAAFGAACRQWRQARPQARQRAGMPPVRMPG